MAVIRAYIRIRMIPITGAEQKEGFFYSRIWENYKCTRPAGTATRTLNSVNTRCEVVIEECLCFEACYHSKKNTCKSEHSEDKTSTRATAEFNNKNVFHLREDAGNPFWFIACWEVLYDLSKSFATNHSPSLDFSEDEYIKADENDEEETKPEVLF